MLSKLTHGVAVGEGFSAGGFVAEGTGDGAFSGTTLRVGSGNAGALRLLLLFALLFALAFAGGVTSFAGSGDTASFALGLAFTFAAGVTVPPDGNPCSAFPLGGCAGCTG